MNTSQRIAAGFSFFTALLVICITFIIVGFFKSTRMRGEKRDLQRLQTQLKNRRENETGGPQRKMMNNTQEFDRDTFTSVFGQKHSLKTGKFFQFFDEGMHLLVYVGPKHVLVRNISGPLRRTDTLRTIFLWTTVATVLLSYFIGKMFVAWSLRDLHRLAQSLEKIDIDNLAYEDTYTHLPEGDQIRSISLQLQKMSIQLQSQIETVQQFVSNASHELRTPLMILRSSSELAQKTKKYEQTLTKNINTIAKMEALVETLLSLSVGSNQDRKKESVAMKTIVEDIVQPIQNIYAQKNLTWAIDTDSGSIHIERGALQIVARNLIENACKYTPSGGTISVSLTADYLLVADNGMGMSVEEREAMWTPFWQKEKSGSSSQGWGLGLSVVNSICDVHGREIQCDSSPGEGTRRDVFFTSSNHKESL